MRQGILLYGPPAAGKDTVTAALTELNARYVPFTRLKIGSGKTRGYRMGTPEQLADLEARGDVIYRNDRYGNIYVVDRPGLDQAMQGGRMPVVHLGQMAGMEQVSTLFPAHWDKGSAVVLQGDHRPPLATAGRHRHGGSADRVGRHPGRSCGVSAGSVGAARGHGYDGTP
ncbi:guanylate kinase [Streptomyces bluensis]|uniref:guanylate kinase n=1 Tax=Streptomyces bluensis TaxID=33897 RepID=UPI00198E9AB0|nr:guanylate kinase [Streptomyces bluensis]GGZ85600.1 hypothetical protein GCM10010344_61310 [Streptomyces bluensis]